MQVRFVSNASAFEVKRTCVFSKMYLRFGENAKAFDLKWFGVLRRVKQNRLHALKKIKIHADGFYI